MQDSLEIFKALSDINRLRILKALQTKSLCVCEIRELLQLANSTVSQHLKILKEKDFLIEEKNRKWINYMLNPRPIDKRIKNILSSLDYWISEDDTFIKDKNRIKSLDRNIICGV